MNSYNSEFVDLFIPVIGVLLIIAFAILIIYIIVFRKKDASKPLQKMKCTVLEKNIVTNNISSIEYYIIQFENGQRMKMRNLNTKKILISEGDKGILEYKGTTIQAFYKD